MDVWREDVPVWGRDNTCDCIWGIDNLLAECLGNRTIYQITIINCMRNSMKQQYETAEWNDRCSLYEGAFQLGNY